MEYISVKEAAAKWELTGRRTDERETAANAPQRIHDVAILHE